MSKRIVVLSDGTWETLGEARILTIEDGAYDKLVEGSVEIRDLDIGEDITETELL